MSRHRQVLLVVVVLALGIVVVLGATVVTAGLPALLGVIAVVALVTGLLPRRRRRPPGPADVPESATAVPDNRRWTTEWDTTPPPGEVALVRECVAEQLSGWGVHGEAAEPTLLVITELLTNAIEHGHPPVRLLVGATGETVRVEVHDGAPAAPRRRPRDPYELRGRGLHLVDALSLRWSWTNGPTGKTVWAEIPTAWPP